MQDLFDNDSKEKLLQINNTKVSEFLLICRKDKEAAARVAASYREHK
jgi:hypothetical protein